MSACFPGTEDFWDGFFRKHAAVMLLIDPHAGKILEANEAASKFYGYTEEQLAHMHMQDLDLLPPDAVHQEHQVALRQGRTAYVSPHRTAGGEIRRVGVHCSPIERAGAPVLFAVIHDISPHAWSTAHGEAPRCTLSMCCFCKKIKDSKAHWHDLAGYFNDHFHIEFSHSVCPHCGKLHYKEDWPATEEVNA